MTDHYIQNESMWIMCFVILILSVLVRILGEIALSKLDQYVELRYQKHKPENRKPHPLKHLTMYRCTNCYRYHDDSELKTEQDTCLSCGTYIRLPLYRCLCQHEHRAIYCPNCQRRRDDDDEIIQSYRSSDI